MAERIDDLQCNGYKIIQDTDGFCFGMDAVLLANYALQSVTEDTKLLDLCSGTGIVPLLLAAKSGCKDITGLELQKDVARNGRRIEALVNKDKKKKEKEA
jgi:tRNA1Val (adenine37-N6)-methyltransferase